MAATSKDNADSEYVEDLDLQKCEIEERKEKRPTFGFDQKTAKTDLVLVLDGKQLYVTKVILQMASPVFEKMLAENLQESDIKEIKIEGKDYHDFAEFLACFHPGIILKVTLENVYRVQSLAFEYEVECLKTACQSVLAESLKDTKSETNLFKCMDVAYKYNIEELKAKCLKQAVQIYKEDISRSDELMQMETSYKDDICKSIFPTMRSDASKFRFWSTAAKHVSGTQSHLESFSDAKYVATNCKLNWSDIWSYGKEITVDLPKVWNELGIDMTVKKATGMSSPNIQFALCAFHDNENVNCLVSFVIEYCNIIPWKQSMFRGQSGTVTTKPKDFTSIGPENFESKEKGFVLNNQFEIRIHILVNRPII